MFSGVRAPASRHRHPFLQFLKPVNNDRDRRARGFISAWLYYRFSPSFRDVEDLLVERGVNEDLDHFQSQAEMDFKIASKASSASDCISSSVRS